MMPRLAALALVAVFALPVLAEDPVQAAQIMGIEEYRMPNGLRVVVYPDTTSPKITVNLTVLVGSVHEGAGETGMAHVFEHILFHQAEGFPDIAATLKELGGNYNGTTWFDRTNYFETLTASEENLETAIKLEAARLGRAKFSPDDLAKEGKIVESEFDIAASNPQRLVLMGMFGAMYDFHAYSRNPIGTLEDFKALKIENIERFYRKFYRPDNALLVITGKFDVKKALGLVEKHFGDLKGSGEGRPSYTTREPASLGERRFVVRKPGEAHVVVVGWRVPGAAHADSATADLLARMLSSGGTGPLYDAVVKKGLAADCHASTMTLRMSYPFFVLSTVPKDKDPEAVEAAILEVIEKQADALTQADLDRAKSGIEKDFDDLFNDAESMAFALSEAESAGSWKLLLAGREVTKGITLEQVKAFAKKYFRRENRTVGRFTPDGTAAAVEIDAEPDVKTYDPLLAKLPKTQRAVKEFEYTAESVMAALKWQDVAGAQVGLISKDVKGDRVHVQLFMPLAGREAVFATGETGEALASLMTERTKSLEKAELKKKLAELKTEIGVGISIEGASISITTTKQALEEAGKIALDMLRTPHITEDGLKEFIQRNTDRINAQRDEPMVIFQQEVPTFMFPEGDARRGRTPDEQIAELGKLKVEALLEFHKTFLGASGVVGGVVGDVTAKDVDALLRPILDGWKAAKPGVLETNAAIEKLLRGDARVETPGKPSAFSVLLQPIRLSILNADYPALDAAAQILFVDSMSSRIPKKIRVEKALSYATGGYVSAEDRGDFGMIILYSMTKPENAARALEIIRAELAEAVKTGVTEEELASYKKGYPNRVGQMRSDDPRLAGAIVGLKLAGTDFGYWKRNDEAAAGMTVEAVNAALKKYVDPAKMGLLQVGDFATKKEPKDEKEEEDDEEEDE